MNKLQYVLIVALLISFGYIAGDHINEKQKRQAEAEAVLYQEKLQLEADNRVLIAKTAIAMDRAFLFAPRPQGKDSVALRKTKDSLWTNRDDWLDSLGLKWEKWDSTNSDSL
ncbi:MAG: hypothetical protein KAJ19_18560 [Gammaproteobacteria bacterium]|nr:hypothetical protein [Gammaproteobacteria bacterium]